MKINGNLSFHTLGDGELQNAIIERVALTGSPPTGYPTGVAGRIIYNTTHNKYCYYNGSSWSCFATGDNTGDLQAEIDAIELAVGLNTNGTFNAGAYTGATYIITPTSVSNAIMQLDAAINSNNTLAELDDVALGTLVDGDVLQYDTGSPAGWKNVAIGSASGIQPYDTGLVNLATGGTGIVAMNGDSVYFRTLTAPAAGITVTNGTGVGGNPTLGLADDLAAVEGLNTAGMAVRIMSGSPATFSGWATRSTLGTTGNIVVTDGDGQSGNPVVDLYALTIPTDAGNFLKFSYDTYGRVTAVNAVVTADVTTLVDGTYVNITGDTMTGQLIFAGSPTAGITLPTPSGGFTNANDVVNKSYIDNLVSGISWKEPVDSVGATNPGSGTNGQRFLNTTDDKIYTYAGGSWGSGVTPSDNWAVLDKATDAGYTYDGGTGTWVQFTGAGQVNAGTGLSKNGNTLDVNLGAGIFEMPTDEVGVDVYSPSTLALSFYSPSGSPAGRDDTPPTDGKLALFVDATGGIKGGIGNAGTELALDFEALPTRLAGLSAVTTADYIAYYDASASDHVSATFLEVVQDLDIPNGLTDAGLVTRIGEDQYESRIINIYSDTGFEGLYITDGDGIAGNPTIGLDITNQTASSTLDGDEEFIVYNPDQTGGAANVKTTLDAMVTYIQGATTLGELSNVDDGVDGVTGSPPVGATMGHVLYFNGATWTYQHIYYLHDQTSGSTSWSVDHNLDCRYCNVTVVDSDDEVIIPQSIKFDGANSLTITFNTAIDGKAVVMGVRQDPGG